MSDAPPPGPTEPLDSATDSDFRRLVREFRKMGYGRMAQIVDEEWRKVDPRHGGLLAICGHCGTLIDWACGRPHAERGT